MVLSSPRVVGCTALVWACLLSGAEADAQAVALRIHPRTSDTLHTRLDQRMEVSASDVDGAARGRPLITSVTIFSRSIVESSLATSTVVLTVVDSADMHSNDSHGAEQVAAAERALRGQRLLLQLANDGSVESASDGGGRPVPRDLADAMAAMPAAFPRQPVHVGEEWAREMPLPSGGSIGSRGVGYVRARFRLDSLSRGDHVAFVTMRGDIRPASGSDGVELTGTITGTMRLDRERGWMTDSQVSVIVRSLVTPPPGSGRSPMRFVTRVTQRLRTMDKR